MSDKRKSDRTAGLTRRQPKPERSGKKQSEALTDAPTPKENPFDRIRRKLDADRAARPTQPEREASDA